MEQIEIKDKGFETSVKEYLNITYTKVKADDLLVIKGKMVTNGKTLVFQSLGLEIPQHLI